MKKRTPSILVLVLIIAPLVIGGWYISRFSVNIPCSDEWSLVPHLQDIAEGDFAGLSRALWWQHNEHRVLFPKLIMLILAELSDWNVIVEMYFGLFLTVLSLAGWGLIYRKSQLGSWWAFVPVSWLVFGLGQWENILWGWQIAIFLQAAMVIVAMYLLVASRSLRSVLLAALCGAVASFSFGSGLVVWPTGLLCLIWLRAGRRQLALWSLLGLAVLGTYFTGFVHPAHHPALTLVFSEPFTTVAFFFANVGAPVALLGSGYPRISAATGVFLIFLFAAIMFGRLRAARRQEGIPVPDSDIVLCCLVLFSLLSSALISVTRVGFGLGFATTSRYTTLSCMGVVGLYILVARYSISKTSPRGGPKWRRLAPYFALLSVLVVGLTASGLHGLRMGRALYVGRSNMKYALQHVETQPDDVLVAIFPSPQVVREGAVFLREHGLSVFAENQQEDVLLLTSSAEGQVTEQILPDDPLTQTLVCPVQTLEDVEVFLTTYARSNTSGLEITLAAGDSLLVREVLSSAEIEDGRWLSVVLPTPLEDCSGRDLVLRISSPDAGPGNAVGVWTYPTYYEGGLLEQGQEVFMGRTIGLQLNAYSNGLTE